jgi:dTDP-4-dehydrorhamnose reductase
MDTLDISNAAQLTEFVRTHSIRYLLNCAAYTAVDRAEDDAETCMRVNCDAVRTVGEIARTYGVRVIHISTDYVFDGRSHLPYREDDATNPLSVYGYAKLAGEKALQQVCPDAVIIRTAWLYSEFGNNFVKTILRLGNERESLNVVSDQFGTPTCAGDLAKAMLKVVDAPEFIPGIYHYSNEGVCSWYDFAVRIMALANVKCRINPIAAQDYPVRAVRPAYSVLSKEKIRRTYCVETPDWESSLQHCIQLLEKEK